MGIVSRLTKVAVLAVLVLWGLAVMHCKLEVMPGLAFLQTCCDAESSETAPARDCDLDGCGAVEEGGYRMEENTASAPEPLVVAALWVSPPSIPGPANELFPRRYSGSVPDNVNTWQFLSRAAMPPRAPSFAG